MECIVPGANIKVLSRALQALSKIGDDLYIEAKKDELCLTTLNLSKTVCSKFNLKTNFFSCYDLTQSNSENDEEAVVCKVQMKTFLPLFKGNLEKKVDYFKLEYMVSDFLLLTLKYKNDDLTMIHKLRLMDNEGLSIGVAVDLGVNNIGASSSYFNKILSTFNSSDDEIIFEVAANKAVARNYCVGTPCRPKMVRCHMNLTCAEFLRYAVEKDTTINFGLKPLRTLVQFAEIFNLNVDLRFGLGGVPLSIFSKHVTFEVDFIVATLNPYDNDTNTSITTTGGACVASPISLQTKKSGTTEELMGKKSNENGILDFSPVSPESPRTKRAKTVFGRCYDQTFCRTDSSKVLAANSDSE